MSRQVECFFAYGSPCGDLAGTQLPADTAEAVRRGIFGALTFFVAEEMFGGNDCLSFVEEALKRTAP